MNRISRLFGGGGSADTRPGGVSPPGHGGNSGTNPKQQLGSRSSGVSQDIVITSRRKTHDKVDLLAFHPVFSFAVFADRGGRVHVWDYATDTTVYRNQYGGVDEGGMSEVVLRRRAERYSAMINSVGGVGEEQGGKDSLHMDFKRGEKKALQSDGRYQGMGVASGKVVDVGFVDWHVCVWQMERWDRLTGPCADQKGEVVGIGGSGSGETSSPMADGAAGAAASTHASWVVIASENKVTMHDLSSSRGMDFVRGVCFEGAKPTKVACLVRTAIASGRGNSRQQVSVRPVLAVGTSTGAIYLVDVERQEVVGKCAGGHKKGVTCLEVLGGGRRGGPDRLVSGSADGTIAVWDVSRTAKSQERGCVEPSVCFQAHEGGVFDVRVFGMQRTMACSGDHPIPPSSPYVTSATSLTLEPYLASVGADKQLCTWSVATWSRVGMPIQVLAESSLMSIGATARAGSVEGCSGNPPLVGISDKSCALFGLDPSVGAGRGAASSKNARVLLDMEGMLEKGNKKRPKIYALAVNPSKPYVYGLATNTGVVVVKDTGGAAVPSSTSLLSQQVFASAFIEMELNKKDTEGNETEKKDGDEPREEEPIKIPQGITSINVVDNNMVATLYEMKIDKSDQNPRERTMHLENIGSLIIAGGTGAHSDIFANVGGDAVIESSVSSRYISIVWPQSNRYVVFAHGEPDDYGRRWRFIDGGEGRQLVWSSTAPIYAVLSGTDTSRAGIVANGMGMGDPASAATITASASQEPTSLDKSSMSPGFSMTYEGLRGAGHDESRSAETTETTETPNTTNTEGDAPPAYDEVVVEPVAMTSNETSSASSSALSSVRVHAIQETEDGRDPTYMGYSDITLDGDARALKIFGGSLLGISSSTRPSSVGDSVGDNVSTNESLRFFSWVDVSPIGSNLPAPNWISWDPESTMCALGYDTAIQLCAVYPHFHCFATLGIHDSESAFWQIRQLYVSTPSSINVVYVDSRQSFVEEICLADFTGQSSAVRPSDGSLVAKKQGEDRNFVFGQRRLRPSGPVRLVGVKHSYLVVHDSFERPFLISLRNHGLRARSLAAKGDIDTAVALTAKYVRPVLHDGTAQCILAMGSESDYEKVLALPGLSPEMRISISIRHGNWNRAARAFQAHSLGVNDAVYASLINEEVTMFSPSGGIQSLQTAAQRDVIGERNMAAVNNILEEAERNDSAFGDETHRKASNASSEDDDVDDGASRSNMSADSEDNSDSEDTFVDPIDWNSWSDAKSAHADVKPKSASSLSMPIVDHAELLRILESTDLGLELASSALGSHRESSKLILGTLLAYASTLSKDRLEQLVDQMAMANMTESLRNLWSETVSAAKGTKGASQSISVAALLAASVGGIQDANMVESLVEAGLYPLAFLYASVWGSAGGARSVESVEEAWRAALV